VSAHIIGGRLIRVAALALGLSACTGLIPGSGPTPDLYTLSPKSSFDTALPEVSWQLVVEVPFASGGLATRSIALRSNALELRYFAGARWIERAPRLVQTLLVESFENTGRIVAVGRAADLRSDFNLKSELREFQAEYESEAAPPLIRVRLNAKIVQQPQREIIASANFEATARAAGTNMAGIITAFDEAFGKVLRRVVEWTLITADSRS
jgi:cholesterol transport system auxiliary component